MRHILDYIRDTRQDVEWISGPDENGQYSWDLNLPNQSEIVSLISSFNPLTPAPDLPSDVKIFKYMPVGVYDRSIPPFHRDFITSLPNIKLHRKSTIVKGECTKEEFFVNYDGTTYSDLIVKEETTYVRDALGFPTYKTVKVTWYKNDGTPHPAFKSWIKYYSNMEKIQEGKTRRGNLIANLQMPCIGLISIAMLGHPNASPEVILEGRKFLADYSKEFTLFIEDSNKEMISCLNNTEHIKYVSVSKYTWIDTMTPYGMIIRAFIINELTI